jgi:positive phototaxis protein PixI
MVTSFVNQKNDAITPCLSIELTDATKAFLPTNQLVEILTLGWEQVIPVPETSNLAIGVFNWRQNIVWLIDLPILVGLSSIKNQMNSISKMDVVIVKHGATKLGLSVLKTGQIIKDLSSENESGVFLDSKEIYNMISGGK